MPMSTFDRVRDWNIGVAPHAVRHFPRVRSTSDTLQWRGRRWWLYDWECTCGATGSRSRVDRRLALIDWRWHAMTTVGTYLHDGWILLHGQPPTT